MKTRFKAVLLLLILPVFLFANNGKIDKKHSKEKTIHKEYSVNPNAKLKVTNSFGNIDIVTWNENRIVIDVVITVNGSNEDKVQKKLEEINVTFTATGTLVTAKTTFSNKKSSWSWFGNNNSNSSMEINYTIKMPITNAVNIENDYGAISINKLEGHATINCDYGQLIIGELMAENNYLNFDYTSKSTIGYMKSGRINADYSGFTLDKVDHLELNADYTNSKIVEVNEINYNCDYGKIIVEKVVELEGNGDYLSHRIGTVSGALNINVDYGSVKIDRLTPSVSSAIIKAAYTSIKVGYDSDFNFDFSINLKYANLSGKENLTINHTSENNSDKRYTGYFGTKNTGNTININSKYGAITLTKH